MIIHQRSAIPGIGIEVLTLGPVLVLGIGLGLLSVLVLGIDLGFLVILVLGVDHGLLAGLILVKGFVKYFND